MLANIIKKIIFLIMCGACLGDLCTAMSISEKKSKERRTVRKCEPLPVNILREVHGPAFDARYMSITQPSDNDEDIFDPLETMGLKRNADSNRPSFYMTADHTEALSEGTSAWNIDWETFQSKVTSKKRRKRSLLPIGENPKESAPQQSDTLSRTNNKPKRDPWQCERKVKWIHLGPDYYPSHLRTIECTKSRCYYGRYDCMPRSFAVRILQRRRGACADASKLKAYGFTGKYVEDWEWVDAAVNFCCDCVSSKKYYY